jgi:hypothetical protein
MQTTVTKKSEKPIETPYSWVVRDMNVASSTLGVQWFREGKKIGVGHTLLRMMHRFAKSYFLRGGIFRGFQGFRVAVNAAFFQLLAYAKYWEMCEKEKGRM